MKFPGFIGGSYESQAVTADQEKTVNWYPELLESPGATSRAVLYPTPGVEVLSTGATGGGRAHFYMNGREFAVIGSTFYEIGAGGALTVRGTVTLGGTPATISSNGDGGGQLFVTSGDNGYIYDLTTDALTQVAALNGKATMGDHLDGYFVALDTTTSTMYISDLLDGLTWQTGVNFAQRSLAPDRWISMKVLGRLIWLFGEYTTEIWYDTGALFPFAPTPSGLVAYGIAAPFSAAVIGDDLIWLGATRSGRVCVLKAQGTTPEIISHKPLEMAIKGYDGISEAVGDVYSDRGHSFYLISFDNDNVTWAWDSESKFWCERGTWVPVENRFVSWRPRFYASAFGEHRILDSSGGSVYRMSADISTDVDGLPIKRVRRAPAIMDENKRVFYSAFELDLEVGLGNIRPSRASFTMELSDSTLAVSYVMSPDPTAQVVNSTDSITFTPTVTPGVPGYTYDWDFGDGSAHDTNETPSHTYSDPATGGTYTCTLTVTDADAVQAVSAVAFDIAGI